ncbi:hypothetical protein CDD83_2136 [Cordyceps sp. RAO-2017]|nr:hypothetical protein CDD83_2136 [Cordyceps sp. RAO-2017]
MDKSTAHFFRPLWQRVKNASKSRSKQVQKRSNGERSRFRIVQEAQRNGGMVAAILILSVLTIVVEIAAHAGPSVSPDRPPWPQRASHQEQVPVHLTRNHCGSSTAEAQELGCRFDELSFAWQVPECFDQRTIDEFLAAGRWEYFTDDEGKTKVPHDDLALTLGREAAVHVTWAFHITHCLYLRRQMVRVLERGGAMDNHLGAYKHTVHCGKTMLNSAGMADNLHTQAPVIYPLCKPLRDWRA